MPARRKQNRNGIALVLVTGFLALLTLLGIAFAVAMRTERLAARANNESVRARQITHAALAEALSALEDEYYGDPVITNEALFSTGGVSAPDDLVGMNNWEALSHLPASLWLAATNAMSDYTWVDLPGFGDLTGRYAFVAMDCSGLLDANYIGGGTRLVGTNASEISFSNLPEAKADTLHLFKSRFVRFDTMPELYRLAANGTTPDSQAIKKRNMAGKLYMNSLFVHSGAQRGYAESPNVHVNTNVVSIGGTQADVTARKGKIVSIFNDMGLNGDEVWNNLRDYLDTDYIPGNGIGVNNFCTEPVPMINEVVISNTVSYFLEGTNNVYTNSYSVTVELWYPFVGVTNPNNYQVEVRILGTGGSAQLRPALNPAVPVVKAGPWDAPRYEVVPIAPETKRYVTDQAATLPTQVGFDIKVKDTGGNVVDAITPFFMPQGDLVGVMPGLGTIQNAYIVRAADDPRINWDWGDTAHWEDMGGVTTLGAENSTRVTYASKDGDWPMYVRNEDNLPTVGELSFLLYSATPWATFDFRSKTNGAALLDLMTVSDDEMRYGLVNPNTSNTNALAAVFYDMPIGATPGDTARRVTWAEAVDLAEQVVNNVSFTNLSDMAYITDAHINAAMAAPALSPLEMESIIRNSAHLLSPRQEFFTIFLIGQMLDKSGEMASENRAVAVVYRDAYQTQATDGTWGHQYRLLNWRWLDD